MFPGQGSQCPGMAKDLYESNATARELFDRANEILGFNITEIMFNGTADELKQTRVTQPAIFLHSVILAKCSPDFKPDMVAGHSLGEFSALTAAGALDFEDGLRLVSIRAHAMQKACEANPGTMAAILALPTDKVEAFDNFFNKKLDEIVSLRSHTVSWAVTGSGGISASKARKLKNPFFLIFSILRASFLSKTFSNQPFILSNNFAKKLGFRNYSKALNPSKSSSSVKGFL